MLFRRKPGPNIEATQYHKGQDGAIGVCGDADCEVMAADHVHTAHDNQAVALEDGDWIIPEPDGRGYYPCKPDIFDARYERIEESANTQAPPQPAATHAG